MHRYRMHTYTHVDAPLPGDGPSRGLMAESLDEAIERADQIWRQGDFSAWAPKGYVLVDTVENTVVHKRERAN